VRLVGVEIGQAGVDSLRISFEPPDAKPEEGAKPKPAPNPNRPVPPRPGAYSYSHSSSSYSSSGAGASSSADVKPDVGIRVGSRVRIYGLLSAAGLKLNDLVGTVKSWAPVHPPAGRWEVELSGQPATQAIQSKNLIVIP